MRPRCHLNRLLALTGCVCLSAGCASTMLFRGETAEEALEKATEADSGTPLIADIAYPWGLDYVKVEAVALVTNLDGTGFEVLGTGLLRTGSLIAVPAPASAGLLGLAGLAAARRRR